MPLSALAFTLGALVLADAAPTPQFSAFNNAGGDGKQLPLGTAVAPSGEHYVMYTKPGVGNWPQLWIDQYNAFGTRISTREPALQRVATTTGFGMLRSAATDETGALYLSYYGQDEQRMASIAKLATNGTIVWEEAVEHCRDVAVVFPMEIVHDVQMLCGLGAARRSATDGTEIWRESWSKQGVSEGRQQVALDDANNMYVASAWEMSAVADDRGGTVLRKVTPDGAVLWERKVEAPATRHHAARYAFVPEDQGLVVVWSVERNGEHSTIEVHKYDTDGRLKANHVIETNDDIGRDELVIGGHSKGDVVHIAWDDRSSWNGASTRWTAMSMQFANVPDTTMPVATTGGGALPKAVAKKAVLPMMWKGHDLVHHDLTGGGYDQLVDMAVDSSGRVHLVGVDNDDDGDNVRLVVLARTADGQHATTTWQRANRHARPTDIFVTDTMIHVVGEDDILEGQNWGADADVIHLSWKKQKPTKATKAKKAAMN